MSIPKDKTSVTKDRELTIVFTTVNENIYFSDWLQGELEKRGWSQAELARRSNLSRSGVNLLITGRNQPRAETCLALARGLGLAPETVLKAADLLPEGEAPDQDPTLEELVDLARRMSTEEREELLSYALWRYQRRREE